MHIYIYICICTYFTNVYAYTCNHEDKGGRGLWGPELGWTCVNSPNGFICCHIGSFKTFPSMVGLFSMGTACAIGRSFSNNEIVFPIKYKGKMRKVRMDKEVLLVSILFYFKLICLTKVRNLEEIFHKKIAYLFY